MVEKHFFAGNNTSQGFFSYFQYLIKPEKANHIYILKGGPGVGKSSFMKKIAAAMVKKGYSIEYIHCSSDHESLDGIIILELKTAFFDGTAPHTLDTIIPGAVDEIINLGSFLNSRNLQKHKEQIVQIDTIKSNHYKSAYRFLKCAGILLEEINSIYDKGIDFTKLIPLSDRVVSNLFLKETNKYSNIEMNPFFPEGNRRNLFVEAYTANGYIKYTEELCENKKVCALSSRSIHVSSKLLERITVESINRGFHVECYYFPLNPDMIQHLYIPEMDLFLRSTMDTPDFRYEDYINLSEMVKKDTLETYHSELENLWELYNFCIKKAMSKLSEAKEQHSVLEKYYIENMNFQGVDDCFDKVLSELS